jgi:hypothetical protein
MENNLKCSTNKTSLQKVFIGSVEAFKNIEELVFNVNRLIVHFTHFLKFFLLKSLEKTSGSSVSPRETNCFIFHKDDFQLILCLLNNNKISITTGQDRRIRIDRFLPFILEYKKLLDYSNEEIHNFQQIATYSSSLLYANFQTNVQEHFIQKVKQFTSFMIVKKLKESFSIKLLQSRKRLVDKHLFSNTDLPDSVDDHDMNVYRSIKNIFPAEIHKKGVYYDLVARTKRYMESYYQLCKLFQEHGLKSFNFVPLSTSSIPRHVTIDTNILMKNILKTSVAKGNSVLNMKEKVWDSIVNTRRKVFRSRGKMTFNGMIRTDGVSICVLVGEPKTSRYSSNTSLKRKKPDSVAKTEYFQDNLEEIGENKVFIDPNKRDLLYCLGSNNKKIRYTQMQRRKETRSKHYERIRKQFLKDQDIEQDPVMNTRIPKRTLDSKFWEIYMKEYFCKFYNEENVYRENIFRKLRLNSYYNTQKSESGFIKRFKEKYKEDCTVTIGDWSKTNMKHHVTTKGKGFRRMFKQAGFQVFLCNEYLTSKTCPVCKTDSLESFKERQSPRPWIKRIEKVHGLLRCKNEMCKQPNGLERLWNRDDAATLNIKCIVEETLRTGFRPLHLCVS